ncbi:MAG: hypothetical protein VB055_00130 [Oscillospiraceae bacterium]|nr:hypothetical protein [Oscillospiraceae bacterium]
MLLQTVVLPHISLWGITLCVIPTCVACVAVKEGAEKGALFAMLTGLFFCFSGADLGPLYLVVLTFSAALCGALCDRYYTSSFMPALLLSLLSLAICEGAAFLFRLYLGMVSAPLWQTVLLPEILFSALAFPLFYLGAWAISKIGR